MRQFGMFQVLGISQHQYTTRTVVLIRIHVVYVVMQHNSYLMSHGSNRDL